MAEKVLLEPAWKNHKEVTRGAGRERSKGAAGKRALGFRGGWWLGEPASQCVYVGVKGREVREVTSALCVLIKTAGSIPNMLEIREGFYTEEY